MQVPDSVLGIIANQLSLQSQGSFRLTCRSWLEALTSSSTPRTVEIPAVGEWKSSLHNIKRLAPGSNVVVHIRNVATLSELCQIQGCHTVRLPLLDKRLWFRSTQFGGDSYFNDTHRNMLEYFQLASKAVQIAGSQMKVQVALCVRVHPREIERVGTELQKVAANVGHLRLTATLYTVMPQFIQMCSNVCMLDIVVPQKGDAMPTMAAMRALSSLTALGLYTRTKVQPSAIVCFAEVLEHLERVTSLTVAVHQLVVELPSQPLHHITSLHLSQNASVDRPPAGLKRLHLQNLCSAGAAAEWAGKLQKLDRLDCLSLEECSEEALLQLPANFHRLELQVRVEERLTPHVDGPTWTFSSSLGRLPDLQVLYIGSFLTSELFASLHGVVLPRVHTFGFELPSLSGQGHHFMLQGGRLHLKADDGVVELAAAFPNVQTLKIYFDDFCYDMARMHGAVELESAFMTPELFPRLRYIVCHCRMLNLKLVHVSPKCNIIHKY